MLNPTAFEPDESAPEYPAIPFSKLWSVNGPITVYPKDAPPLNVASEHMTENATQLFAVVVNDRSDAEPLPVCPLFVSSGDACSPENPVTNTAASPRLPVKFTVRVCEPTVGLSSTHISVRQLPVASSCRIFVRDSDVFQVALTTGMFEWFES